MLILAHNRYRSGMPSGENAVAAAELALLREAGVACTAWFAESDALVGRPLAQLGALLGLGASRRRTAHWAERVRACGARVVHAHNLFPLFGLGLLAGAKAAGAATAVTLHNHRLLATNHRLLGRDGAHAPRDAAERLHLARLNAAHPSRLGDLAYRSVLARAWRFGALPDLIDAWICLSPTQRANLLAAGVPAERIVLKPNSVPRRGEPGAGPGDRALLVGRLDAGKGVAELLRAWDAVGIPLDIVGDGPIRSQLRPPAGVRLLGAVPPAEVARLLAGARFLVTNPRCYETFGLVVAEAFAAGTPALVPSGTSHADIVDDGRTGAIFAWGDDEALRSAARRLWQDAPLMRAACAATWAERFTPELNLRRLCRIHANLAEGRAPGDGVA